MGSGAARAFIGRVTAPIGHPSSKARQPLANEGVALVWFARDDDFVDCSRSVDAANSRAHWRQAHISFLRDELQPFLRLAREPHVLDCLERGTIATASLSMSAGAA